MIWRSRFDLWYEMRAKKPNVAPKKWREEFWCLVDAPDSEAAIVAAQAYAEHSARMDVKLIGVEHRQTGSVRFPAKLPMAIK